MDLVNLNRGSGNILENDSLFKQDSLFVSRDEPNESGIKKNKSPIHNTTATSSQFKTVQPEDIYVRDSLNVNTSLKLGMNDSSGISNKFKNGNRNVKPSQRNKVILTRSVDQTIGIDARNGIGSQGANSSMFNSTNPGGIVTARMHLNKNTTLELIDTVNQGKIRSNNQ